MRTKNFFKFAAMTVAAVFTLSMTSCDDDDDAKGIKCNPAILTLEVGKTADVTLDKSTVSVGVSKEDVVTVKTGNRPTLPV